MEDCRKLLSWDCFEYDAWSGSPQMDHTLDGNVPGTLDSAALSVTTSTWKTNGRSDPTLEETEYISDLTYSLAVALSRFVIRTTLHVPPAPILHDSGQHALVRGAPWVAPATDVVGAVVSA